MPASAADLSVKQIMADCASGEGKCTFNDPSFGTAYLGNYKRVSDELHNCTSSDATQSMTWSDTVGSSDTAGVTISVGGKIEGIVDVSVQANYSHTWNSSHSESSSLGMTVKPGEVGWISRAQVMRGRVRHLADPLRRPQGGPLLLVRQRHDHRPRPQRDRRCAQRGRREDPSHDERGEVVLLHAEGEGLPGRELTHGAPPPAGTAPPAP
ncbi:hypothetical protein [Streptomyces thioluteus]|uniref:hypothetical protein n=1 Tax=Streptomyces thioluteus TaxID=66431 RepID=UPI0031E82A0C